MMWMLLTSEWLKTKRTAIRWFTFCMPVVFSSCAAVYLSVRSGFTQEFAFEGFFTLWTVFIIPVGAGVLSGAVVHSEELAGDFNGFLATGIPRARLYLGKFLILLFCLSACTLIAVLTFCAGMNIASPGHVSPGLFIAAAALSVAGSLPLLALHLWVSFLWGMGASVGMSICGLLMAALLGLTRLGLAAWPLVPWTWPVKLGMLPGACFLKDGGTMPSSAVISGMARTGAAGLAAVSAGLTLSLIGGIIWFNIWEGRKTYG